MRINLPNVQEPEKYVHSEVGALDVIEVFSTIQGEGPFMGEPAVFVRLAGCNLQCPFCDTDYTTQRRSVLPDELVREVEHEFTKPVRVRNRPLVVLTGGEPLRQGLGRFAVACFLKGYHVQVETNGTMYDPSLLGHYNKLSIVCSPKTPHLNGALAPHIAAYKYVVRVGEVDLTDGLPTSVLGNGLRAARPHAGFLGKIYLQPCDERDAIPNKVNAELAAYLCMKFGYTLCLQLHKIVGLP